MGSESKLQGDSGLVYTIIYICVLAVLAFLIYKLYNKINEISEKVESLNKLSLDEPTDKTKDPATKDPATKDPATQEEMKLNEDPKIEEISHGDPGQSKSN